MIITRTPFRVSFAGGGSDLRDYYSLYTGAVLSATINKYVYLSMHPHFDPNKIFLKYSKNELVDMPKQIEHRIIAQVFEDYSIRGVDFNSSADVPAGTGMASSSAFTCGLIQLCNTYTGKLMSKEEIASYASDIEINRIHEPIGKQDQYACACGGFNFIQFYPDETVSVEKISISPAQIQRLESSLCLFYLGKTREAGQILAQQKENTRNDHSKIHNLHKMVELAKELKRELEHGNIQNIGSILDIGWRYKKEMANGISNPEIDAVYETARQNGALGGKLLGAGGTGFLLFFIKPEDKDRLKKSLPDLKEFPFQFEQSGTTVIYSDQNSIKN